jgi:hypothetical protein
MRAMLAYSSQNPCRVSLARPAGARPPGFTMIHLLPGATALASGPVACATTATSAAKENLLAGKSVF